MHRLERRLRLLELRAVAVEDIHDAVRVVEAHERVGDEEARLRKRGPVGGHRHRRLELRGVLVPDVADDGQPERLGLVQVHEPRSGADE